MTGFAQHGTDPDEQSSIYLVQSSSFSLRLKKTT
jgi:hypothetical protein